MIVTETCSCGREFTKHDFEIETVEFVGTTSAGKEATRQVPVCSPECAAQVAALSWSTPKGKV